MPADVTEPVPASGAYQVLARKYRPGHFRDLIGQEAMVRTLTNAFETGRISHAFILTGVRGVGKTTTARIIAKGLNCTGRGDRPTIDPCGECLACVSIAEGRNTDVLEMDAASNTGVGDIREIIDSVRYRAAQSRYKVYVIDEVHMLSTNAFNALLKTLEEPPEHVKFVFATTEIRKVPVTVLSRCQRFDLRRIEPEAMMAHLAKVAAAEGTEMPEPALALVTRAAEGSVRDALSLLDQAIALEPGSRSAEGVRAMLGLADRARVIDLFEAVMKGDAAGALSELAGQYAEGADPAAVLRDLAELTHWISVLSVSPDMADDPTVSPEERARGRDLASRVPMPALTRAWQMLLKSMEELPLAPNAMMAAEMAVIRLTHVADLPPPETLVRRLMEEDAKPSRAAPPEGGGSGGGGGTRAAAAADGPRLVASAPRPAQAAPPRPEAVADPRLAAFARFGDVLALLSERRELRLLDAAESFVELVSYRPGHIEFHPAAGAPAELAGRLKQTLGHLTGARWTVAVSGERGEPTVAAAREAMRERSREEVSAHPAVLAVLSAFPGAEIADIRPLEAETRPAPPDWLEAVPDPDDAGDDDPLTDDPFEED